jgi:hypothetical protein
MSSPGFRPESTGSRFGPRRGAAVERQAVVPLGGVVEVDARVQSSNVDVVVDVVRAAADDTDGERQLQAR